MRRIADVADKYNVPLVKLTGGQRIDLLGLRKEDLPKVWQDLDMPSGYAYGKSYRTCKSCVGYRFLPLRLGDSIALAMKIEQEFQGFDTPAQDEVGYRRLPAKLFGGDGEGSRRGRGRRRQMGIYVGGAAGSSVRKGDILCVVDNEEDVLKYMGRFIQYYRENAKYLERTYGFVERIGIDRSVPL